MPWLIEVSTGGLWSLTEIVVAALGELAGAAVPGAGAWPLAAVGVPAEGPVEGTVRIGCTVLGAGAWALLVGAEAVGGEAVGGAAEGTLLVGGEAVGGEAVGGAVAAGHTWIVENQVHDTAFIV